MINTIVEILLVEDTRSDAEMTMRAIRKNGVANRIIHVEDGVEALEFLSGTGKYQGRDTHNLPKVILLDLKMPRVSGVELLKHLKEDALTRTIPVVVLTSSKENPDIEKCYALGVNSYIVKPVASEEFMNVVAHLGLYWILHNQVPESK